jgi:hypothetical protein
VEELDPQRQADGWGDALAILSAALRGDEDAVAVIMDNCDAPVVVAALAGMVFRALRDRQVDVADWVANEQAMMQRAPS